MNIMSRPKINNNMILEGLIKTPPILTKRITDFVINEFFKWLIKNANNPTEMKKWIKATGYSIPKEKLEKQVSLEAFALDPSEFPNIPSQKAIWGAVRFDMKNDETLGYWWPTKKAVVINISKEFWFIEDCFKKQMFLPYAIDIIKNTIKHEMMHVVQDVSLHPMQSKKNSKYSEHGHEYYTSPIEFDPMIQTAIGDFTNLVRAIKKRTDVDIKDAIMKYTGAKPSRNLDPFAPVELFIELKKHKPIAYKKACIKFYTEVLNQLKEENLIETHIVDMGSKAFVDFVKKYKNEKYLYVNFSFNGEKMDRNAYQKPDHSDFTGVYAYPIDYVVKHPADIWYGSKMPYIRVLKDISKNPLYIDRITTEDQVLSILVKCGMDYKTALETYKKVRKTYNRRNAGPTRMAKDFLSCLQMKVLDEPEGKDWGVYRYPTRTGKEQTDMLLKAGFDAVIDQSRTSKRAVVNEREPEQICFLTRGAFEIVEVIDSVLPMKTDKRLNQRYTTTFTSPDFPLIERPFVVKIAEIMGDKIDKGHPERSSLNGWSYYWTKMGRRIGIEFTRTDYNDKKHRQFKQYNNFECNIRVKSEYGDIEIHGDQKTKFEQLLREFSKEWNDLVEINVKSDWKPQNKQQFNQQREEEKREYFRKKALKKYQNE